MSLDETLVKTKKELRLNFIQKTTATTVAESCQHTVSELCRMIDVCSVQIHTGRTARLQSIKLLYVLFAKISTDRKALAELEESFRNLGEWNTSKKLLNALVQKGLGVDRKLASKYSKVIFHALQNGIPDSAFEHFVKEHGGIEAIQRFTKKKDSTQPTVPTPKTSIPSPVDPIEEREIQVDGPIRPLITSLDSRITDFLRQKIRETEDRKYPVRVTIVFRIDEDHTIYFRERVKPKNRPTPKWVRKFIDEYIARHEA